MPTLSEKLKSHRRRVTELTNAGITPPDEWTKLDQQLTNFLERESPVLEQLTAAVLRGDTDPDELALLRAWALAETAMPQSIAKINSRVIAAVETRLFEVYAEHAQNNYRQTAGMFDAAATAFTKAANIVDPEKPAADMVNAAEDQRVAWLAAEQYAHRLETLVPVLHLPPNSRNVRVDTTAAIIALSCDPGTCHRRRVWEAWQTKETRCGRWSALHALGVTLRPFPSDQLSSFTPYHEPRALEVEVEQVDIGVSRRHVRDPEDQNYQPAVATDRTTPTHRQGCHRIADGDNPSRDHPSQAARACLSPAAGAAAPPAARGGGGAPRRRPAAVVSGIAAFAQEPCPCHGPKPLAANKIQTAPESRCWTCPGNRP